MAPTETTATTATSETDTAPIRLEPCAAPRLVDESTIPVCETCGWLEDDHTRPITVDAVVTQLPRREAPRIERKAS
jgi:hypothetical protein